jgi:hypothetical protein
MKRFLAVAMILLAAVLANGQNQGGGTPTLEDLQAVKALLPMTPEEILGLTLKAEDKDDSIEMEINDSPAVLTKKEKEKLQKKGLVVLRIVADVSVTDNKETNPKKKVKAYRSGSAEIYVIDAEKGKVVSKKKEGMAKLCPS